jgi:hypothetical protein
MSLSTFDVSYKDVYWYKSWFYRKYYRFYPSFPLLLPLRITLLESHHINQ